MFGLNKSFVWVLIITTWLLFGTSTITKVYAGQGVVPVPIMCVDGEDADKLLASFVKNGYKPEFVAKDTSKDFAVVKFVHPDGRWQIVNMDPKKKVICQMSKGKGNPAKEEKES